MRIAQVAPLMEPVPPGFYGGTERVVSFITEELVRRGHQVTLFASGDSRTGAALRSVRPRSIRLDPDQPDPTAFHLLELAQAFAGEGEFDLIHCHLDFLSFPFARFHAVKTVHTLHGRLDLPHWRPVVEHYPEMALVSVSNAQRAPLNSLRLNWRATAYHGLPSSFFQAGSGGGGYLCFFSRIAREKRPDLAVEVAQRTGLPLKMAGKVDPADRAYFDKEIKPLLDHPLVEYLGEVPDDQKTALLGDALAVLLPIDWPEPFGLVMIEAMACGTPVIARPMGAAREVVQEGETGFLVDSVEEMAAAVGRAEKFDRARCMQIARQRFSVEVMVDKYEEVYRGLLDE